MITLYIVAYVCASFLMSFASMYAARRYFREDREDSTVTAVLFLFFWPIFILVGGPVLIIYLVFKAMQNLVEKML